MTPQERDLLTRFLDDLSRSSPGPKDREAADQIERALQGNPDASYVLVQHAILSDQALNDAQQRIADLENQLQGGPRPDDKPSFLGAAFGKAPANPPNGAFAAGTAVPPSAPPQGYAPYGQPGQPPQAQPWGAGQPGPFSGGGGLGNFLRGAGTTAAGVAGGAFLFEGLSGLFGGHRGGGFGGFGGGQGFGGFGGQPGVENVTINDYGGGGGDSFSDDRVDYDSDNGDPGGDSYS